MANLAANTGQAENNCFLVSCKKVNYKLKKNNKHNEL